MNNLMIILHIFCVLLLTCFGLILVLGQLITGHTSPLGIIVGTGLVIVGVGMVFETYKDAQKGRL